MSANDPKRKCAFSLSILFRTSHETGHSLSFPHSTCGPIGVRICQRVGAPSFLPGTPQEGVVAVAVAEAEATVMGEAEVTVVVAEAIAEVTAEDLPLLALGAEAMAEAEAMAAVVAEMEIMAAVAAVELR